MDHGAFVFMSAYQGIWQSVWGVVALSWWFIIPLALSFVFWDLWVYYIRERTRRKISWILLEIVIPRENEKTPRSMEQIFAALMSSYSYGFRFKQKYWDGKIEQWFSWEIVGTPTGVHFYVRLNSDHRNLVESAIYSQYPDAELHEVPDYLEAHGTTIPNRALDIWGTELVLGRDESYPIRTYPAFETKKPEAEIDPIATILEAMSRLKDGERIMIQLLIRPTGKATGNDWVGRGEALRDTLINRKKPVPESKLSSITSFFRDLVFAFFRHPDNQTQQKKEEKKGNILDLTPGEREVVEGIEKKISKLGFESLIRFIFIDDRDHFTRAHISAVFGSYNLFNTHNMNTLRPNKTITIVAKGFFKKHRLYLKKRRLYDRYLSRYMPDKAKIFNIEELATLYHFPSIVVEAPLLRHVPARKGEPPPGLPVE